MTKKSTNMVWIVSVALLLTLLVVDRSLGKAIPGRQLSTEHHFSRSEGSLVSADASSGDGSLLSSPAGEEGAGERLDTSNRLISNNRGSSDAKGASVYIEDESVISNEDSRVDTGAGWRSDRLGTTPESIIGGQPPVTLAARLQPTLSHSTPTRVLHTEFTDDATQASLPGTGDMPPPDIPVTEPRILASIRESYIAIPL